MSHQVKWAAPSFGLQDASKFARSRLVDAPHLCSVALGHGPGQGARGSSGFRRQGEVENDLSREGVLSGGSWARNVLGTAEIATQPHNRRMPHGSDNLVVGKKASYQAQGLRRALTECGVAELQKFAGAQLQL